MLSGSATGKTVRFDPLMVYFNGPCVHVRAYIHVHVRARECKRVNIFRPEGVDNTRTIIIVEHTVPPKLYRPENVCEQNCESKENQQCHYSLWILKRSEYLLQHRVISDFGQFGTRIVLHNKAKASIKM